MKSYYIFILMFSSGLMGTFALLGSNEVVSPFVAITGIVASIAGGVGACIDMKSKI